MKLLQLADRGMTYRTNALPSVEAKPGLWSSLTQKWRFVLVWSANPLAVVLVGHLCNRVGGVLLLLPPVFFFLAMLMLGIVAETLRIFHDHRRALRGLGYAPRQTPLYIPFTYVAVVFSVVYLGSFWW